MSNKFRCSFKINVMQSLTSLNFVIITIYFAFIINTENTQTVLPQRLAFKMLGGGEGRGGVGVE